MWKFTLTLPIPIERARRTLQQVVQLGGGSLSSRIFICLILFLFNGCADQVKKSNSFIKAGNDHYKQAQVHFDRNEWRQAETDFTIALHKLSKSSVALYASDSYVGSRYEVLSRLEISRATARFYRGLVLKHQRNFRCALVDLNRVASDTLFHESHCDCAIMASQLDSLKKRATYEIEDIEQTIKRLGWEGRSKCP